MYDMLSARVNRLIGKMDLFKKTPETAFFKRKKIGISSLWEDLEAKLNIEIQLHNLYKTLAAKYLPNSSLKILLELQL